MRPELAAFRDLDTLVRNLGDQLAGYRRRAHTSEGRVKELQATLDISKTQLEAMHAETQLAEAARDAAHAREQHAALREASLRETLLAADRARVLAEQALADHQAERLAAARAAAAVPPDAATPAEVALSAENERLRARLVEARDRTTQLVERLKFLRQQMTGGSEK